MAHRKKDSNLEAEISELREELQMMEQFHAAETESSHRAKEAPPQENETQEPRRFYALEGIETERVSMAV